MNKIKQALYVFIILAGVVIPSAVGAALTPPNNEGFDVREVDATTAGIANESIFDLISNFLNWMLGILGVLAVIAFVIAGVMYLTSAGDTEQAEKGKNIMLYAIIGLVVALLGLIIVNAIAGLTGGAGVISY